MSKLAAVARPLPDAAASDRIIGLMIREAVTAERDRRAWNNLKLSQESGVPYSRLYEWLNDPAKTIHSGHLESLMRVLGLRICRGRVTIEPVTKRRAAK